MSYKCPSCGSDQTASIAVAHARESQSGSFGGVGVSAGGVGAFGGSSSSVSDFGRSLAPPTRGVPFWVSMILALVTGVGAFPFILGLAQLIGTKPKDRGNVGGMLTFGSIFLVVGIASWIVCALYGRSAAKTNVAVRSRWQRLWVCYQCGRKFDPSAT